MATKSETPTKWYGARDAKGRILVLRRHDGCTLLWLNPDKPADTHCRDMSDVLTAAEKQHGFKRIPGAFVTVGRSERGRLYEAFDYFAQTGQGK